jgi:two-component system cell cycle response regulator
MKILIAEDETVSRRFLEVLISRWGYQVIVARDGLEAWQILQGDDAPRLAVLDWMMPGLEGTQVCQNVRQRTGQPYTFLLLLTGRNQKCDLLQGLEAGADDYLTKPFDPEELRARLHVGQRIIRLQDELIAAHDTLQFQATHDPLTKLWNSTEIQDILRRELARSQRQGSSLGVIMADLDHFKCVNDTYGHLAGDAVLQEVTRRMSSSVRPYDAVGRWGGEEFVIVVAAADAASTWRLAERIRTCIAAQPVETEAGSVCVTISMGTAVGGANISDPEMLLRAADAALYRAKKLGRNRVELATPAELAAGISPAQLDLVHQKTRT